MFEVDPSVGHRLLAPRIAFVIGTVGESEPNLAPISNLTSISRDPQMIVVAVYREWQTYENLQRAAGFTVSVPRRTQNDAVWRLGDKYSGFVSGDGSSKLEACGTSIDYRASKLGPVLSEGIGWLECEIAGTSDVPSDHGIFFGLVTRAAFDDDLLTEEGRYLSNSEPIMQVVGNTFATSSPYWTNEYF